MRAVFLFVLFVSVVALLSVVVLTVAVSIVCFSCAIVVACLRIDLLIGADWFVKSRAQRTLYKEREVVALV
jgi:hypothetical protein